MVSGEEVRDEKAATKKKLIDFSVGKEPPVIAIIVAACVVGFGHFVSQIHLVNMANLLTKFVRSRWLDVLSSATYFRSVIKQKEKKTNAANIYPS